MKEKFTERENIEIYLACNLIRASFVIIFAKEAFINNDSNLGNIALKAGKDSIINQLVQDNDWENLFKNQDWLGILETAQNLNILNGNKFSKDIIIIRKHFPKEINGYIFP